MNNTLARVQNLVGQAGEALGLTEDPLSTVVGSRIQEATRDDLDNEDWALNMEICDIINHTEEGPEDAVKAFKRRLHQSMGKNSKTALFTLTLLETCVKNCDRQFRVLVCSHQFVEDLLGLGAPGAVREQMLGMLQSWALAFRADPGMSGVVETVAEMRARGVPFPEPTTQDIILTSHQSSPKHHQPAPNNHSSLVPCHGPVPHIGQADGPGLTQKIHRERRAVVSVGRLSDDQIQKLKQDIEIAGVNIDIFNELLTELTPGQEHPEDKQLLVDLSVTCQEMQRRVVELLSVVENRELTSLLLDINDNINNQLLRYERYTNNIPSSSQSAGATGGVGGAVGGVHNEEGGAVGGGHGAIGGAHGALGGGQGAVGGADITSTDDVLLEMSGAAATESQRKTSDFENVDLLSGVEDKENLPSPK